jgi:hypothetical protein
MGSTCQIKPPSFLENGRLLKYTNEPRWNKEPK